MKPFRVIALMHLKSVTVISDGTESGTSVEGLTGDEMLTFESAIRHGSMRRLGSSPYAPVVKAEYHTPMGIVAALHAAGFGQVQILRAPKAVRDILAVGDVAIGSLPEIVTNV